jgi:hypothetical protein
VVFTNCCQRWCRWSLDAGFDFRASRIREFTLLLLDIQAIGIAAKANGLVSSKEEGDPDDIRSSSVKSN